MSDDQYILEKKEEEPLPSELLPGQVPAQEMTPVEKMIPLEASLESEVEAEKFPRLETELKRELQRPRKMTRIRQTRVKLSQLLKQAKKNDAEIYEMRKSIESLDRGERIAARTNLNLMKQLHLQLSQLRNQVLRIQKDLRRMRTPTTSPKRIRKPKVLRKTAQKLRTKVSQSKTQVKTKRRRKNR